MAKRSRNSRRKIVHDFDFQRLEPRALLAAGLLGEYFDQIDLTELVQERVDPVIEFPGGFAGSPPDIGNRPSGTNVAPDDNWSIRWTGSVLIDTPGDWTFHTDSNDGVQLSINNSLVIDAWDQHPLQRDSGTVNLDAGWHAIQLDYFQQAGTAAIRLLYEGPGQAETVIPSSHLDSVSVAPPAVAPSGTYVEENGLVIMEAENTSSDLGQWQTQTQYANFTGDSYLQFTGNNTASGPPNSPLEYRFKINRPGLYLLDLRMARDTTNGQPSDHSNDAYVRVEGDYCPGPNPGNTHGDDAPLSMLKSNTKFFGGSANSFVWAAGNRLDPGGHMNKRVAVYDFKAGEEYLLVVSGRSKFFSVDRIMFRHVGESTTAARNVNNPESQRGSVSISGELKKWHKTTLTFDGPVTSETATTNPFTDYRLDVTFTHAASGKTYFVPGYYAADGDAANSNASSGNKWRVHFGPDETGEWTYAASFRQGTNIAVADNALSGSSAGFFDGATGLFEIKDSDKTGSDNRAKGRLEYVGERYLQYAETGEYFIKQGPDAPENLLAYEDFDGNFDNDGNGDQFIKDWAPHVGDWNAGDPTWDGGKGKGLIGAVNYLASEELNSISFLTMNIGGDDKNVFPYTDYNQRLRMDVSRLDQWEIVFDHADAKGMYLHFKTQETENDQLLDGGALGLERKLYYRELVARFSHHLALNWNVGEENTNTTQQRKDFAEHFKELDPYDHNIVLHTFPAQKSQVYSPLLGTASEYTGASLQTGSGNFNEVFGDTLTWVNNSANAGKPWVVAVDEPGNANDGLVPDDDSIANANHTNARKNALWGTLMAGGAGNEWYFGYQHDHSDLTLDDFRSRDEFWDVTRYAKQFFTENGMPFWEMTNDNSATSTSSDYVLSKTGEVYAVYLKNGGPTNLDLSGVSGNFNVAWFDPRNGGNLQAGSVTEVVGGNNVSLGFAPNNTNQDWAVLITVDDVIPAPTIVSFLRDGRTATSHELLTRPDQMETFSVAFDRPVNVAANDLKLAFEIAGQPSAPLNWFSFSYDPQAYTASWTFGPFADQWPTGNYVATLAAEDVTAVGYDRGLLAGISTHVYKALPGDANQDGAVDVLQDAASVVNHLGLTDNPSWGMGNFNGDGAVDVLNDAAIVVENLGQSIEPPVPTAMASLSRSEVVDFRGLDIAFANESTAWTESEEEQRRTRMHGEEIESTRRTESVLSENRWLK